MTIEPRKIELFDIAAVEAVHDFEHPEIKSKVTLKDGTVLLTIHWTGDISNALLREYPGLIMHGDIYWDKSGYEQ